jgi:flagellar biosynthesis/type III secretory pathway protein FliH
MSCDAGMGVEIYRYPAGSEPELPPPSWICLTEPDPQTPSKPAPSADPGKGAGPGGELKIGPDLHQRFEAGRKRGFEEGRKVECETQTAARLADRKQRMEQLAALVEKFALERDRYLHEVEHEVVELALAVAARILRREAQMDPLLLTGAVRVALGQLSKTTKVRLQVPTSELELWTDAIALIPNLPLKPDVLAGDGMREGDCVIKTEMGSVDLGIRAQLGEIERGFFDRAGRAGSGVDVRPQQADPSNSDVAS